MCDDNIKIVTRTQRAFALLEEVADAIESNHAENHIDDEVCPWADDIRTARQWLLEELRADMLCEHGCSPVDDQPCEECELTKAVQS